MKNFFKIPKSLHLSLFQLVHRYLGPKRNDLLHIFHLNGRYLLLLVFHPAVLLLKTFAEFLFFALQFSCFFNLPAADVSFHFFYNLLLLLLFLFHIRRHFQRLHPLFGTGLVQNVDCFVRQKPVVDIPAGKIHRIGSHLFRNQHSVMRFKLIFEPFKDLDCFFHRRLLHQNRLKPPHKCCILLKVFGIFLAGCSPDQLKVSPCERGLQDVGCVHGSLRTACPDHRVNFVNKENH